MHTIVALKEIKTKAPKDDFINKMKMIWKENKVNTPMAENLNLNTYSVCDNIQRIVSFTQQNRILKDFHIGHLGMSRMKALVRGYVYYLKMDKDIENLLRPCRSCALTMKSSTVRCQP